MLFAKMLENIHRTLPRDPKVGATLGMGLEAILKAMGCQDHVDELCPGVSQSRNWQGVDLCT